MPKSKPKVKKNPNFVYKKTKTGLLVVNKKLKAQASALLKGATV